MPSHRIVTLAKALVPLSMLMATSLTIAAPFTNGNVAVYRAGTGAVALSPNGDAVFIDEYTPAGTLVQSIALPVAASGLNRRLIATGTATSEGFITRSSDSNCLLLTGYDAAIPTAALSASTSAATNRVVAVVNSLGVIDTTTALTDFASGNNPRSAASNDCNNIWVGGGAGGVRFAAKGTAGASTQLNAAFANVRQVFIESGQLYASAAAGATRLATIGTGLPTTAGQAVTALPGFPATASAVGVFFADLDGTPGVDTLYVADESNGLLKYCLVAGTWQARGVVGVGADLYRGLTGVVSGITVTLYATRKGGNVTAALGELVRIVDATGYNANITATPSVIATAGANTTFHGVALVPLAPNQAPTISAPASITVTEDIATALTGISFADPDAGGASVTATLSVGSGTLAATTGGGVTVTGSGTGSLSLVGSIANINAFIAASNVTFTTALNATASVTLTVGINDGGNTGTGGAKTASTNVTLTVSAVNDAPTASVAASFTASVSVPTALTGISFADVDAGAASVTATIGITSGTFAATSGSGVTVGGSGTGALTLTGSIANINAFVAAGSVTYTGVAAGTLTLTIGINDGGNTGSGGAQTGSASTTIAVSTLTQTLAFGANPGPVVYSPGGTFTVSVTASSGLPVTYSSATPAVCTASSATVTIVAAGSCTINANQAGNATYSAATQVQQTISITQAAQTITGFAPATPVVFGAAPATLTATGGASGNPIVFATTSAATICTVSGSTVTFVGVGTCNLTANQAGNTNYAAATQVTAAIVIGAATQTITFGALANRAFGSAPFTISATGGASANPITFASTTATTCTVSGTTVTLVAAGTCTIRASQTGNANYSAAADVDQSFTVTQASQAITGFAPASPVVFGTAPATLTATGGASGNPIIFATTSPAAVCTVSGTTVTFAGVGTCNLTADQAGNTNYAAAPQVAAAVTITQAAQTINFAALTNRLFGTAPFTISATGGASGNPVTFASVTATACTVSGTTVTLASAGTCTIRASQAGNANYGAATDVDQSFTITQGAQAITGFAPASPVVFGAVPATLNAMGGASGNPVVFAATSPASVCTVAGSTVTFVGAGTCNLTANQAGNVNYAAAAQATAAIVINPAAQTIAFAALANRVFGTAPFAVSAAGGASGNPVTFASTTATTCTVSGAIVTLVAAGTCTIRASQTGNANYSAATDVDQSFTITQAAQSIAGFAPASPVVFGAAPATLTATGGASGNPILFATTSAATVCTVSGSTVTFTGAGTCNLTANQAGNANYAGAPQVTAAIVINPATQAITFAALTNRVFGTAPLAVSATGGASGNPVTFASTTATTCNVSGATVTLVAAGTCTIRASQVGNANYSAATDVDQSFTITQAPQTITGFAPASPVVFGAAPATLAATGGASGQPVVFATSSPATVCTVTGNTVTFVGVGTCNVIASQAGNANYAPAATASAAIVINQSPQAITGFTPASPVSVGAAPATLVATGGASGNPIVFATTSAATICAVMGSTVTFLGLGTCNLTANQAGNANYAAATQVTAAIVINAGAQVITFVPLVDRVFGVAPFTVTALGGASGNPVIFTSQTPATCTTTGTNGATVTVISAGVTFGTGTCTIRASQAGNANYSAAVDVDRSFAIARAPQTLTGFGPSGPIPFSAGTFVLTATGGASGNPVEFRSLSPAVCTVTGNVATIVAVGICTVSVGQNGNTEYSPPTPIIAAIQITPGTQTINFDPIADVSDPSAGPLAVADASSGLPVTFVSLTPSVCTVFSVPPPGVACGRASCAGASIRVLRLAGTGLCTIQASQAGNANFDAAPNVSRSFNVGGAMRLDTSATIASYAEIITLTAYVPGASVTGNVNFSIDNGNKPGVIPACGNVPVINGVATCLVPSSYQTANPLAYTARFSGDANNVPASVTNVQSILLDNAVLTLSNDLVSPIVIGTQTTVTALVRMRQPVGSITFYERITPADAPAGVFNDAPIKDCVNLPVVLLADSTDAATATCSVTARGVPRPSIVAVYSYPAAHISGRVSETRILQYTTREKGPADYSDMWWAGQGENGWGISVTQHGAIQFNVIYAYDTNRTPLWYVMPGGSWDSPGTTFTGALYRPNGARFDQYDVNQFRVNDSVGTASITYTSASTATLSYTINGVSGKKNITRQIYALPDGQRRLPVNDLWWAGVFENGWGLNISQQGSQLFPVWYTYNSGNTTTFFPVPGGRWNSLLFTGEMYTTVSSPWLGTVYDTGLFIPTRVGRMFVDFANANDATITYEVNGIVQTKRIQRQPY
jgi:lysophospholipase L1-like esterase